MIRRLLAALAVSWVLSRWGPWPAEAPFRGTLVALPVVLGLLAEIARQGRARGGRRLPPRWVALALGLLAAWLGAALAFPFLPLGGAELPLFGAFALLVALHAGVQLLALRPLLGRRLPERPSWLFAALPFTVYLALLPWATAHRPPDGDEPWYLLITRSLAYDFDADLTNDYAEGSSKAFLDRPLEPQPGDPLGPHGERYSRHNALLPLVLAPAFRLAGKEGALVTMALLTALLAWMTLRLARRYFPHRPGEALLAYALVGFSPPLLLYSYQIWVEVPAALLAALALDGILGLRDGRYRSGTGSGTAGTETGSAGTETGSAGTETGRFGWVAVGVVLVLLPLLKIRFMLISAPLLLLAWWHAGRPWRPLAGLGLLLGAVGGGILLFNQWLYHNPLKIHSWQEVELNQYSLGQYGLGASGLFFDAAFGLFACAPLWLLLIPAAVPLLRARTSLPLDLVVLAAPYLLIVTPRSEWYGGWSPPFRYALLALPLLGLALVPLLAGRRRPGARMLIAALGFLTLGLAVLWVAVPGWTYNFADGRTYLLDHLSARFGADVARLFPSSVRPRPATWAVPLAALVAVPALWWLPWPRLRRPATVGVMLALLGLAGLPGLARSLPTRRIELEDAYVTRAGGHLSPDPWVIERTRHRGGWVIREGEAVAGPVVAGGERVRLSLDAFLVRHHPGPAVLSVFAGDQKLSEIRLSRAGQWRRYELGEIPWTPGRRLKIRFEHGSVRAEAPNGAVLDRVDFVWR